MKFILLSYDTVLVPYAVTDATAEPVVSNFYLEHGGSRFLQNLISVLPNYAQRHNSGGHCYGSLESPVL